MQHLSLEGFKEIHGIKVIKFDKTSTNRLMANNLKFQVYTKKLDQIDLKKPLYITYVTEDKDGNPYKEPFYIIHNSGKLTSSDVEL